MLYYASKISPNMGRTPEGYLICQNVPIARTGKQVYLAGELPLEHDDPQKKVTVFREGEDVFSPAAMASFEGKPVTDEHPEDAVTPANVRQHIRGIATNIRRGRGDESDVLLADLVIYDATLQAEIEDGKREVSCGYDCEFEVTADGRIFQRSIEGNHIAVVDAGRAGDRVAIKDENPEIENQPSGAIAPKYERRTRRMGIKTKRKKPSERGFATVLANIFPMFSKDAAPEDIVEAVEDLIEAIEEEVTVEPALEKNDEAVDGKTGETRSDEKTNDTKDDEPPEWAKVLIESIADCMKDIKDLKDARKDSDPLEKLEEELSGESDDSDESDNAEVEAEFIEPADEIDEAADSETEDVQDDEGVVMPPEDRPKTLLNKDAKNAALKHIRLIKPIIAAIPDVKQRKVMADSMEKLIRATYGISSKGRGKAARYNSGYAAVLEAQRKNANRHRANDSKTAAKREQEINNLGRKIAEEFNPHYKKDK